jgi:phage terminase small subunit
MRSKGATRKGVPANARSQKKRQQAKTSAPAVRTLKLGDTVVLPDGRKIILDTKVDAEAYARGERDFRDPQDPAQPLRNKDHERFACEYLKDFNATQAYLRVSPKVTEGSAATRGSGLLRKVEVQARVEFLARQALDSTRMDSQGVIRGLVRIAAMDPRKAFDKVGNLIDIPDLPDEVALAISGIEVTEEFVGKGKDRERIGTTKKLRFNDRGQALVNLGKIFKIIVDRSELSGPGGGPVPVQQQESPETKAALARMRKRLAAVESRVPK